MPTVTVTVTRPTCPGAPLKISGEKMVDVEIRDHDGTPVVTRSMRAWDGGGTACVNVATTPRPVWVDAAGVAFVTLFHSELGGMRVRNEAMYWLGVA